MAKIYRIKITEFDTETDEKRVVVDEGDHEYKNLTILADLLDEDSLMELILNNSISNMVDQINATKKMSRAAQIFTAVKLGALEGGE